MGCVSSSPADGPGTVAAKYHPSTPANAVSAQELALSQPAALAQQQGTVATAPAALATTVSSQSSGPAKATSQSANDVRISLESKLAQKEGSVHHPHGSGVNSTLGALSAKEASTVQATLLKVSSLIQKFAEGRSERTTPIQALRRALDLVLADTQATFASVQVVPETLDTALLVALIGAPDQYLEFHRLQRLGQSGTAAEVLISSKADCVSWDPSSNAQLPVDWQQLVAIGGMRHISSVPVKVADRIIGILTLGFPEATEQQADHSLWATYLQLVASSLAGMVKDSTIPKYLALVKEVHASTDVDGLVHRIVQHMRGVLGHSSNHHVWYRLALTGSSNVAATIFDDLTQVPAPLMQRGLGAQASSSSYRLLKEVQAQGGVMRSVVPMKSTVMKISVHNRQQVMIPDVQKLINQSGNVSVDIFNTRLIKPPTSVLVFPLKVKQHIFGVVFCMSSVATDFADVSPRLRELCEVMSPHILALLTGLLEEEYAMVRSAMPASTEGSSMSGAGPPGASINYSGRSQGDLGASQSGMSAESFVFTQSRSSTGALVTGLTEKLNQKRIKSSMDFAGNHALGDLQVTSLLGEGGFAKVFKGLWRGLVVGIKVVCDDGKNEKMVMKNAHEIAILAALSHPNIVQAYQCLTDVAVREMLACCFRTATPTVMGSSAYKYLASMEERPCHIEVIEYCDLGNLSTALKYAVFQVPNPERVLACASAISIGEPAAGGSGAAQQLLSEVRAQSGRVQMRTLLLSLIEIASAMGYLHIMGVVHCDLKPANVLLRSSNIDTRGFTAKVSDFGLSRVEDDDTHSSFPFNSCGTAAYVAPEALISNKKVNASVDVYAFGILMWEMYTGARPYGNMKQQALVEEVVMRGLRPKFPSHTPPAFVALAQACWSGAANSRPTFDESLTLLNTMLTALDERKLGSTASASFTSGVELVEYMGGTAAAAAGQQGVVGPAAGQAPGIPTQSSSSQQQNNYAAVARTNGSSITAMPRPLASQPAS